MDQTPSPHRNIPWLAVVLGILALITFWNISGGMGNDYGVMPVPMRGAEMDYAMPSGGPMPPMATEPSMAIREEMSEMQSGGGSAPAMPAGDMDYRYAANSIAMPVPYYPYGGGTPNAEDTREFNKIYYGASMQTRDVPKLVRKVETTVRGHEGRIDSISSSDTYGSVSFVVPQSKFEKFRDELEGLVNSRFLKVNINTQNMLSQKQAIEKQQDYTKLNIEELAAERKKQIASFNAKKQEIQYQIDANDRESEMIKKSLPTTPDQPTPSGAVARLMELTTEQGNLRYQLRVLESTHLATINSIDARTRYLEGNEEALEKQDQALLDDVATVNGSVSIQWISLWQMAQVYLPGYSIPGILAGLAVIAYIWNRKRGLPV